MKITSHQVPASRGVPELVVAQLSGAVGGLLLALDELMPHTTKRPKIVDRDLTRC